MHTKLLCIVLLLFAVGCSRDVSKHFQSKDSQPQEIPTEVEREERAGKIEPKKILGDWILIKNESEDQFNYPSAHFTSDSQAVFTSRLDTLYRFRYSVRGDSLILKDINNNETVNRIKVLNKSVLIFSNLLMHNTKQVYKRQ